MTKVGTSTTANTEIREGLKHMPVLNDYDKEVAHLLVFDDLVLAKNLETVSEYYLRCRHFNVSAQRHSGTTYSSIWIPEITKSR
jgi:hypothetical protein